MLRRKPTRVELGPEDKRDLEEQELKMGKIQVEHKQTVSDRIYGVQHNLHNPTTQFDKL